VVISAAGSGSNGCSGGCAARKLITKIAGARKGAQGFSRSRRKNGASAAQRIVTSMNPGQREELNPGAPCFLSDNGNLTQVTPVLNFGFRIVDFGFEGFSSASPRSGSFEEKPRREESDARQWRLPLALSRRAGT
jgi:hypothetical protein